MKANLYKVLDQYHIFDGDKAIATTIVGNPMLLPNLSKQNCDEIFGSYNPKSMMKDILSNCSKTKEGYILGFQMAMVLNKDKLFTVEDITRAISFGQGMDLWKEEEQIDKFIQSRQQPTEIEVEIEMEMTPVWGDKSDMRVTYIPKLDSASCLILKKI
jgi:hypothetical protein